MSPYGTAVYGTPPFMPQNTSSTNAGTGGWQNLYKTIGNWFKPTAPTNVDANSTF
jgi:hypothetical protein